MLGKKLIFSASTVICVGTLCVLLVFFPLRCGRCGHCRRIAGNIFIFAGDVTLVVGLVSAICFRFAGHHAATSIFGRFDGRGGVTNVVKMRLLGR